MRSGPRTHHWRPGKMRLVEDAWRLDAGSWQRTGLFKSNAGKGVAADADGRKLQVDYIAANSIIKLRHAPFGLEYAVPLDSVATPFGEAIYFMCPIAIKGTLCRRRCRLLFMPPNEGFFGCRVCHRLAYRSSQEAGKRARAIRQADFLDGLGDILEAWL